MRSWTATRPREATVRGRGGTASASASATTMTGSGWTWTHPRGAPPCPSCGSVAMHAIVVVKQRMHIRFGGACTAAMAAATKNCALSIRRVDVHSSGPNLCTFYFSWQRPAANSVLTANQPSTFNLNSKCKFKTRCLYKTIALPLKKRVYAPRSGSSRGGKPASEDHHLEGGHRTR